MQEEIKIKALINSILDIFTENEPTINYVSATDSTIIEIIPHPDDRGILIGKGGRVVRAIRNLIKIVSGRIGHSLFFRIIADGQNMLAENTWKDEEAYRQNNQI